MVEGKECVWSPWDCPVCCEGSGACQRAVDEGIVNHIARECAVVWCKYFKMELGGQHRAGDWAVLPITKEQIWVVGCLDQARSLARMVALVSLWRFSPVFIQLLARGRLGTHILGW